MELNKISLRSVFALVGMSRKMCRKMCYITGTDVLDLGREGHLVWEVEDGSWLEAQKSSRREGRGGQGGRQGRRQLSGAAGRLCPLSVRMERFSESRH